MTIFKPLLREVLVEFDILTKQLKAKVDSKEFASVFDHQKLNSAMNFVNFEKHSLVLFTWKDFGHYSGFGCYHKKTKKKEKQIHKLSSRMLGRLMNPLSRSLVPYANWHIGSQIHHFHRVAQQLLVLLVKLKTIG